jgi:restriction system protein
LGTQRGPKFVQYFEPVLSALRALGGSARPAEVVEQVAVSLAVTDAQRSDPLSSGTSRFDNMVAWARFYLAKAGMIDASRKGVWTLTDKGRSAKPMSAVEALTLFKEVHQTFSAERRRSGKQSDEAESDDEETAPEPAAVAGGSNHREEVLQILMSLPPTGFEHFCKRLLREAGFQEVTVTGGSGTKASMVLVFCRLIRW